MRVGFIFECGRDGADGQVCHHLVGRLKSGIEIDSQYMDDKKNLLENCGTVASLLVRSCDKVVIIWDLYPSWREKRIKPCRKEDREKIFTSLQSSEVPLQKVSLVCIEQELEAWLLADMRAVKKVLERYKHPRRVGKLSKIRNPERINPKTRLDKIFKQQLGDNRGYNNLQHAIIIAEAITDFNYLKRSSTFRRFAEKATGVVL